MAPALANFEGKLEQLLTGAKQSDYFTFNKVAWEQVQQNYDNAAGLGRASGLSTCVLR
jgi:hypothetical protein